MGFQKEDLSEVENERYHVDDYFEQRIQVGEEEDLTRQLPSYQKSPEIKGFDLNDNNRKVLSKVRFGGRPSLAEVKMKLKEIFEFYASFGDRLNTDYLKSQKFHKMMMDAGLVLTTSSGSPARSVDSSDDYFP